MPGFWHFSLKFGYICKLYGCKGAKDRADLAFFGWPNHFDSFPCFLKRQNNKIFRQSAMKSVWRGWFPHQDARSTQVHRTWELQILQGFSTARSAMQFHGRHRAEWLWKIELHGCHLLCHGKHIQLQASEKELIKPWPYFYYIYFGNSQKNADWFNILFHRREKKPAVYVSKGFQTWSMEPLLESLFQIEPL